MNVAVIGVGGVGGYFGGKLTQLLKSDSTLNVSFVARGDHLREIQRNGLILDSDRGEMICVPTMAAGRVSDLPAPDLCLVCVKSFDLENVLYMLKGKISDRTILLPLLNGVDIYERIRRVIKNGIILPSCVYVGTHIEKAGRVTQRGGSCTIHFGKDPVDDYMDYKIFDLFEKAGIKYSWMRDPYTEIWSKYIFIASFGLVTAAYDKTLGEVMESEDLSHHVKSVMKEIVNIAAAKSISFSGSVIEDAFMKGGKFPFDTKTSFQRDFADKNKFDERDLFGGTLIRMGHESGIETPVAEFIYDILQREKPIGS